MAGIGGCPNVGGVCIGCTMPGFPDKFMPFMDEPPGAKLSATAVELYGRTVAAPCEVSRGHRSTRNRHGASYLSDDRKDVSANPSKSDNGRPPPHPVEWEDSREALATLEKMARPRWRELKRSHPGRWWARHRRHFSIPPMRLLNSRTRNSAIGRLLNKSVVTFMAALGESTHELYVSPQIENLLGYTQKEWLENPFLWYNQLYPEDRQRWQEEFARTCTTGVQFRSEYRFIARDGRIVWVHGECQVIRDHEGHPMFLQGVAYDISDSKLAHEKLRTMGEHLEKTVQERTADLEKANRELAEEATQGSVSCDSRTRTPSCADQHGD